MEQSVYLISPETVKATTNVNLNVTDDILSYAIRVSQDMHLSQIIGESLLNTLKQKAKLYLQMGAEIEEPYYTLLYSYVIPFLASQSVVEVCIPISFKIRNIGVVKNSNTNAETQGIDDILRLKAYYEGISCDRANRITDYLSENVSLFPELQDNGFKITNKHYSAVGLYLG